MKKRTTVLWKKILAWVFGILIVIGVWYLYWKTDTFRIHTYDIVGAQAEVTPQLAEDISKLSEKPFLKVIPTNKLFTYRGKEIQKLITDRLPNTKSVVVRAVPLHSIRIIITPHDPLFRLEGGQAITKDGYVYTEVHDISRLPLFALASSTFFGELKAERQKLEVVGATSTELLFGAIADIVPKIDAVLFRVGFVEVNEYGDVVLSENVGGRSVKLTSQANMEKQWSTVISAIDTEPLKGLLEAKPQQLEYIDVRFGNKVFYRFTNKSAPAIIPPHATSSEESVR